MLERIVENWLTSASELGFQAPFVQLLVAEGHAVLQGPTHHPFEHGKDIITVDPEGRICAFQLKMGDIGLSEFRRIESQLLAMVATSIGYPGTNQDRLPQMGFLVTSGTLSAPARDELRALNNGNLDRGLAPIDAIERFNLVGRFSRMHANLPALENVAPLLDLLTADGRGPFRTGRFLELVESMLDPGCASASRAESTRALAEALMMTGYVTSTWAKESNHLALAEAWLSMAYSALRISMKACLVPEIWKTSYDLALATARGFLDTFVTEAAGATDLVVEHVAECLVYPARALVVCGWAATFLLSERTTGQRAGSAKLVQELLARELPFAKVPGEGGALYLFAVARALEVLGEPLEAAKLMARWLSTLAAANQASASAAHSTPLPNPYYTVEESIMIQFGVHRWDGAPERFDGRSYTALQAIDWLARRDIREPVQRLYAQLSRLLLVDVEVSDPWCWLSARDDHAQTKQSQLPQPGSWAVLREEAASLATAEIPSPLAEHPEIVPFLGLVLSHRFNRRAAALLDRLQ